MVVTFIEFIIYLILLGIISTVYLYRIEENRKFYIEELKRVSESYLTELGKLSNGTQESLDNFTKHLVQEQKFLDEVTRFLNDDDRK